MNNTSGNKYTGVINILDFRKVDQNQISIADGV